MAETATRGEEKDWKDTLKLPTKDTRVQTAVSEYLIDNSLLMRQALLVER